MTEETKINSILVSRLTSEVVLGSLVALLSILTAVAAYQNAITDAKAGEYELQAVQKLTESNTEYILAGQSINFDYTLYDSYFLTEDDLAIEYYEENFSDYLADSLTRDEGPFDDAYYDDQFSVADELYDEAITAFESGEKTGTQADRLQLVMLVFAVGLSFAAWASLVKETGKMRLAFSVFAIVTLGLGLVTYGGVLLSATGG